MKKYTFWIFIGLVLLCIGVDAYAAGTANASGIGGLAGRVQKNLSGIAKLITGASYVAGMAFAVGAVVKFKAHKDNPTQEHISKPIALLFIAAALMFIPSVFSTLGGTLYGASGTQATVSGVSSFT